MIKRVLKNPFLIVIVVIVFLFLTIYFVDLFLVKNRLDTKTNGAYFELVGEGKSAEIKPAHNLLNIVVVSMKNPGLVNHENYIFQLYDTNNNLGRSIEFKGDNIGDPSDLRFQFEPISGTKDKTFNIKIFPLNKDTKSDVKVSVTDDGNISYTTYYKTENKRDVAKDIVVSYLEKTSGDWVFFAIWGVSLGVILVKGYRIR